MSHTTHNSQLTTYRSQISSLARGHAILVGVDPVARPKGRLGKQHRNDPQIHTSLDFSVG